MLIYVGAFFGLVLLDYLWALYTHAAAKGQAVRASVYGSALWVLSTFVVVGAVNDLWILVPAAAGSFVGTYIGVKHAAVQKTSSSES